MKMSHFKNLSPVLFMFLCYLLMTLLFKMAPSIMLKCCMTGGAFKGKKLQCDLQRKYELEELPSRVSYSAPGCEFHARVLKVCIK